MARCAKFTGTAVAWINCWKATLKGFSDTKLQWLDRTEMAGTMGMDGTVSKRTDGQRGDRHTWEEAAHSGQTDKANTMNESQINGKQTEREDG